MPDQTLEANSYAIAYRLLGDRPAAQAVAGIASERLRQCGGSDRPDWLYLLVEFTLDQTVDPGSFAVSSADQYSGLRSALRRRLERAAPDERVAGSLLHLSGYPLEFVSSVVQRTPEQTASLAGILAPPPGLAYRDLGDPELTGAGATGPTRRRRTRRPHWTTIAAVAILAALIVVATQVTGPRPTLGPELEENGMALDQTVSAGGAHSPS